MDLDPEGGLGPCDVLLLGTPGFPADRTQQNQPDNATPDRSCKDRAAALRERDGNGSGDWPTGDFSLHHWGKR